MTLPLDIRPVETPQGRFLVLGNDGIGRDLLNGKWWEPHFSEVAKTFVRPGHVCIDGGANFGYHTVTLARLSEPSGIVYAFEPLTLIFYQLCANLFLNGVTNVVPKRCALGKENGQGEMQPVPYTAPWVNIGAHGIGKGGEKTDIVSIDSLPEVTKVDFIKLDIQGSEVNFFLGAKETVARDKPVLFVEVEEPQLARLGGSAALLISMVKDFGYSLFRIETDYPVDHLCIPCSRADQYADAIRRLAGKYKLTQVWTTQCA